MSHSSPWFSVACAATIVHGNQFHLYQKDKASKSKIKFRQASNCCKMVLDPVKLAYAHKTKDSKFGKLLIVLFNKGRSALPLLVTGLEVLPSASNKAKLFAKDFAKNSNLSDSGISLPVFPSRTDLNLHNISATPKMIKKVIMNTDLSKASGPDYIPVAVLKNCVPELTY